MIKVEERQSGLMAQAEQIAGEFSLTAEHVRRVTKHLVRQLSEYIKPDSELRLNKILTVLSHRGRPRK